jgi:hypothetical protein
LISAVSLTGDGAVGHPQIGAAERADRCHTLSESSLMCVIIGGNVRLCDLLQVLTFAVADDIL